MRRLRRNPLSAGSAAYSGMGFNLNFYNSVSLLPRQDKKISTDFQIIGSRRSGRRALHLTGYHIKEPA
ncbi:hypothetical protein TUM17561_37710 [Enterobacter cloacae]|nr:hypothetical protein TUM17561_37710 [Enterobacter cloacae]